ncbi:MAG: PD-(D/E)XK nuclease family transposase [Leptospiraceae bacterium]|nr:PD-(D/E)XK nuclease family transposase [Leptospiraceae bacterium]MCP5495270.1 PD-(D/E)XK nuclease family transposase [Leptospiraceae bacterium]
MDTWELEKSKYINPFTDFGFKRLFGEEGNKDLLIDFLNELVLPIHKIVDLTFKNVERLAEIQEHRKAVYDIFCTNQNGEKFIIEMQKAYQKFFKDRMIFYSTFPIREQALKGKKWNYKLKAVYCIGILDFEFNSDDYLLEEEEEIPESIKKEMKSEFHHDIQLKDQYNRVFYPKLRYKLLEMPKFTKAESELYTHFDKWIYFLKNLPNFSEIPSILREPIFEKAFQVAETSNFNEAELDEYMSSLMEYWDLINVIDSSFELGKEEGKIEGKVEGGREKSIEIAKELKKNNIGMDIISKSTGLTIEEIEKL